MQFKFTSSLLLLSVFCCIGISAQIDERFRDDYFKIYRHTAIEIRDITREPVTPDKVRYFLYTRNNAHDYVEINYSNADRLKNDDVNIVFIIHGWIESRERQWYEDLKNAFLNREQEYYVVEVDWSEPAHQSYTVSSWNTKDVGKIIGEFIVDLYKNHSIPLEKFLVVGHSLGGQISGFIGKKVQELTSHRLPRIVALDPAGPFFIARPENERLNKNDAKVVHVIHTDGGTFGFKASCGTIDFYPNGGSFQPGCAKIDLLDVKSVVDPVICNHHRSCEYFVEAVLNPQEFVGTRCGGWTQFRTNYCDKVKVAMGDLTTTQTGDFYLETNRDKPFGTKRTGLDLTKVLNPSKIV